MNDITQMYIENSNPEAMISNITRQLKHARDAGLEFGLVVCTIIDNVDESGKITGRRYRVGFTPTQAEYLLWAATEIGRKVQAVVHDERQAG